MSNLLHVGDEELGMRKRKRTQEYHLFFNYFCHFCYKSIMKSTPQTELHYNRLLCQTNRSFKKSELDK